MSTMHQYEQVGRRTFEVVIWTLTAISTLFFASRVAVRMLTKGKLMMNDYFLIPTVLCLWFGAGLLQSTLSVLYSPDTPLHYFPTSRETTRLTASVEMLWAAIYFVKFCFLAQFNFHQPPYSYVSVHLTRYYWVSVVTCLAAFFFTIAQPIVLCPSHRICRYINGPDTFSWEIVVTVIDILSTMQVFSTIVILVYLANFSLLEAIINLVFKGLFVLSLVFGMIRLVAQHENKDPHLDHIAVTYWLTVEAAIALLTMSISSYRAMVVDLITNAESQPSNFLGPVNAWDEGQVTQDGFPEHNTDGNHASIGYSSSKTSMFQPPCENAPSMLSSPPPPG